MWQMTFFEIILSMEISFTHSGMLKPATQGSQESLQTSQEHNHASKWCKMRGGGGGVKTSMEWPQRHAPTTGIRCTENGQTAAATTAPLMYPPGLARIPEASTAALALTLGSEAGAVSRSITLAPEVLLSGAGAARMRLNSPSSSMILVPLTRPLSQVAQTTVRRTSCLLNI